MLAKRLTLSLLAVGVISLVVTAASFALFTASTTNANNTFTAGTVGLDQLTALTCDLNAKNLAPGDSGSCTASVTYEGSLDAWVGMVPATGTGDLFGGAHPVALVQPALPLVGGNYVIGQFTNGQVANVTVGYNWSTAAGNEYQGKSGVVSLSFLAVQARNNTTGAGPTAWN